MLAGTWIGQKSAQPGSVDPPTRVQEQVGGDRRRQDRRGGHDHRQDAAVAEKRQPERAEQRACGVKDKARLACVEAERLQAVVQAHQPARAPLICTTSGCFSWPAASISTTATMATTPAARPSAPSRKLTVFCIPTSQKTLTPIAIGRAK